MMMDEGRTHKADLMRIDLNADLGEGYGPYTLGDDAALLDLVTSANVACGFHGGDPSIMVATASAARARGVAIGAHPGFQDLRGFGRRVIAESAGRSRQVWPTRSARSRPARPSAIIASPM